MNVGTVNKTFEASCSTPRPKSFRAATVRESVSEFAEYSDFPFEPIPQIKTPRSISALQELPA
jgi:hypothetical protein